MFRRKLVWGLPVAAAVAAGAGADRWLAATEARQEVKPAVSLPVTRVVLFTSGVGHFTRGGEVDGDARVDLTFPEADVNDLIKSMVLEDLGGGRVAAVSYDSREPVSRTLASFAINLDGEPTFAGILRQARGERVEVTIAPTAANQPGKLVGSIVGVEAQKVPAGKDPAADAEVLNLWCAEGLRAVKLADVQQLRFSSPVIESEFRRALEVLALNHDAQKKAVSLHFAGDGRRQVRVGYVVEAPVWKASYRLVLDAEGKGGRPYLQGWAVVENPTDEDWQGVRMALVSGRPISFRMDLYDPLYVPRPTVEPELFASLRPPTYSPGFRGREGEEALRPLVDGTAPDNKKTGGLGRGPVAGRPAMPTAPAGAAGLDAAPGARGEGLAFRESVPANDPNGRFGRDTDRALAARIATGSVGTAATAGSLGDFFQYAIDHPVTLPRQKSALLPVVGKEVEGTRVSIYNPAVQPKHPLLGLRFKNTSGVHLAQGPVTVFEGSTYAGDTRVLDVQPGEERLVSYAIDLGTEVDPQTGEGTSKVTSVKAVKGVVTTTTKVREVKKYRIANRSQTDRTLLIEHPNRTNQQVKLVETEKPVEDTRDVYRFQVAVKAGEEKAFVVTEERDLVTTVALSNSPDDQIRHFTRLNEASPALKQRLEEALKLKAGWDNARRELAQVQADLARLAADQDRIRKNLANTPKEAEVYQTYLKKLSDQEREIDALTGRQKQLMADEFAAKKRFDDFLANLTTD